MYVASAELTKPVLAAETPTPLVDECGNELLASGKYHQKFDVKGSSQSSDLMSRYWFMEMAGIHCRRCSKS